MSLLIPCTLAHMGNQDFLISLSLRNACVVYFDDRNTRYRSKYLSNEGVDAMVHGFSEYQMNYIRLTTVVPTAGPRTNSYPISRCRRGGHAVGVPYSCNNVFHQLFHAVPAFERFAPIVEDARRSGDKIEFLPVVYPSTAIGRRMTDDPRKWHAWEFSLRALSALSSAEIAQQTARVIDAPCTCYETVEINVPAFNPLAPSSARRLRAFRDAAMRNVFALRAQPKLPRRHAALAAAAALEGGGASRAAAGASAAAASGPPTRAERDVLWITRVHAKRNVVNEAAVSRRVLDVSRAPTCRPNARTAL